MDDDDYGWTDGRMDGRTDGGREGGMDGWMDGWIDDAGISDGCMVYLFYSFTCTLWPHMDYGTYTIEASWKGWRP